MVHEPSAALHQTILGLDIEGYAAGRLNADQVAVREGFYGCLRAAFGKSGIAWDACYREDRGDGALLLIPPQIPKGYLVTPFLQEFAAALRAHNQGCGKGARVRVRLALHAGEVLRDSYGVAGTAVNLAFRLLEAAPLKQALANSRGVLAVIASSWFFDDVITNTPGAEPASYRRVRVRVKETDTAAWICLPDDPNPSSDDAELPPVHAMESWQLLPALSGLAGREGRLAASVQALGQAAAFGEAVPSRPVRLAPRPLFLAGRDGLLAELDARLAARPGWSGPQLVVLHGLGGAGKTSVAVEYAHRHLAEAGVCWQFAAEDPAVLAAEFAVLAAQLGVRELADARDPVASVHAVLARATAGWLVVFDNVPDRTAVERFVPPAGPGQVLITTQNQHWPPGQALEVPVLDLEVAADFLVSRTGEPDRAAARELASVLGGLPLALEQACAYMQATGIPLAAYLPLFRDRQADLLVRGQAAGHPADVAATLGLALSRLAEQAPAAAGLVRLLAFLAPEPVPLALLLARTQAIDRLGSDVASLIGPLLGDPVAVGDAVAALRRYSLVIPAGDGLVLMHRLAQVVIRAQLTAEAASQWEQGARALVDTAVPSDAHLPAAWPACAVLLPHVRMVLDLTSGGMSRIARYLGFSGSYPAARDLYRLIADAYAKDEAYGPEHPRTLTARHEVARWTGVAGDARDAVAARDQLAALLPIRERVLGPEHPDTLATRQEIARWAGVTGDAARARNQLAALLPITERVLGPEHFQTIIACANLAYCTGKTGDAAAARDQLAALLPLHERVLGLEHPETLGTRREIAHWAGEAGDAAGARDQLAALLPIIERVLGPEHPMILIARREIAHWAGLAGDAAGARDQLAALLPVIERVMGPEHYRTLAIRADLARWAAEAGKVPPDVS